MSLSEDVHEYARGYVHVHVHAHEYVDDYASDHDHHYVNVRDRENYSGHEF